jgi:hypothetical protein
MICVLSGIPEWRRGHDISGRINTRTTSNQSIQSVGDLLDFNSLPNYGADCTLKRLPCLNPIEDFEQQSPKEYLTVILGSSSTILNFTNQILAYSVSGSINISESVVLENWI